MPYQWGFQSYMYMYNVVIHMYMYMYMFMQLSKWILIFNLFIFNRGSKVEKSHSRSKDKYHSNSLRHQYSVGHSHSHHSNPPTIQRSNSHPSKYSTPLSRRGSRSSDSDDRSRDNSVGRLYKLVHYIYMQLHTCTVHTYTMYM